MAVVVEDGVIKDASGELIRKKMVCEFCVYAVEVTNEENNESFLICAHITPVNTSQLPLDFRCMLGRWLCRENNDGVFSPIGLLSLDEILQHRLGNQGELEVLSPWL